MSGIETIKIIVNAEKEAAKILEEAQNRASEIRKRLASAQLARRRLLWWKRANRKAKLRQQPTRRKLRMTRDKFSLVPRQEKTKQ